MKSFLSLILAISLTACVTTKTLKDGHQSVGTNIRYAKNVEHAPSIEETERALRLFAMRAPLLFGITEQQALDVLSRSNITYTSDSLNQYAPAQEGYIVTGYAYGYMVIVLSDKDRNSVSNNALIHELTHVIYWVLHENADSNHAEAPGPWTAETDKWIDETMEILKVTP